MSLNYRSNRIYLIAITYLFISLILASCSVGRSTVNTKSTSTIQDEILAFSKKHLGKPYKFSGKGPNGFDCSGFTAYVFRNFGYKLNSSSSGQDRQFPTIAKKEDLAIGDLVFFEGRSRNGQVGHVGIVTEVYSNKIFKFIHSSTTSGVIISSSTEPYYSSRYLRGGRVLDGNKIYDNTEKTYKILNSEPNPPSPTKIIAQNDTGTFLYTDVNSKIEIESDKYYKKEEKSKDGEKDTKDKKESSLEHNSDFILRDDTILIPPPLKIHIVEMGETLYSISKKYDCTVEELISWNPQLSKVLKSGDMIQIAKLK